MIFKKPKTVDSISPFHELYDELKEHKLACIILAIVNLVLIMFIPGLIRIQLNNSMSFLSHRPQMSFNLFSIVGSSLSWWWMGILLYIVLAVLEFTIYRSIRKTYKKNYDDNYLKSDKETFGGAHFQDDEELDENFDIYDDIYDTVDDVYGTDDEGHLFCLKDGKIGNKNRLFYGSPGSGKSASIVKGCIYQGLRRGISLIITDTKGDLYKETSAVARRCDYTVRVLNIKPNELRNTDGFDMFQALKPDSQSLETDVEVITNVIMQNTTSTNSTDAEHIDYWYKNEFVLIKMVILYVVSNETYINEHKNTFPQVYQFLVDNPDASTMTTTMGNVQNKESMLYKCWATLSGMEARNLGQVINGASLRLQKFAIKELQHALGANEIDMTLPMKERCLYYVIIPDQDNTFRCISTLFFTLSFMQQCNYSDNLPREEKKKQLPVHYVLDEYKATGGIVGLADKIATVRSRKIELTIILQDAHQLAAMYTEEETSTIKNCCTVKGMLATNDIDTAEEFSKLLGTQTVVTEANRYFEGAGDIVHAHATVQKTMTESERPLVLPEDFLNGNVASDEILYVINGMPPVRLKKYFCEKRGEIIHPMEQWGRELKEPLASKHLPRWRYELQKKEAEAKAKTEQMKQEVAAKKESAEDDALQGRELDTDGNDVTGENNHPEQAKQDQPEEGKKKQTGGRNNRRGRKNQNNGMA